MTGELKSLNGLIHTFFTKKARAEQSMEHWLYNDFLHGFAQITAFYDAQSTEAKAACDELFLDCHMTGKSFSHPAFDHSYTTVQRACAGETYGRKKEVFDSLRVDKEAYDATKEQQIFFEHDFLPRLKELQEGAAVQQSDYELFYVAQQKGKQLAPRYNRHVTGEFKPAPGTYASYMSFLQSTLEILPEPPGWQKRKIELDSNSHNPFPLGGV